MEQPQYNLFHRKRVEQEYAALYDDIGLGLTTWSPLASGLLTGKYAKGIPEKSRATLKGMDFLVAGLTDHAKNEAVGHLQQIAASLDCSVAQLAIAWAAKNPRVSTVILGASSLSQFEHNMKALEVLPKLSPEVMAALEAISAPLAE
jgi:aryl-alcohol dehydrogenase-like predicted oxidoreductase